MVIFSILNYNNSMDSRNWPQKILSEFIELYRENPCLWKVKASEYSDKNKKNDAYDVLLVKLKEINPNSNRQDVAKKINSLRSCFRKEYKKVVASMKSGAGTDDIYKPNLWYFDSLMFLKDHEMPRSSIGSDCPEFIDTLSQNPNEDTEWNDILRSKGILPPKKEKEITEEDVINLVEQTVREKQNGEKKDMVDMSLDELDELEDDEDERILEDYRRRRIAELKEQARKDVFGEVVEISGQDFVSQINKAGPGIWVVLLLHKQGIPICALLAEYLNHLARKFPATKFVKSISTTCIPNYPDSNLPTIFIYYEGDLKQQFAGPRIFSLTTTQDEFEWMLGQTGAVKTKLKDNPRPKTRDVLFDNLLTNM